MSSHAHIGKNRTGVMTSPIDSKRLLEAEEELQPLVTGDIADFVTAKVLAISEADPLGSVPPPASVKGVLQSGAKMITGSRPQVFLDKLAERAAYERGGTRLYDALIVKFNSSTKESQAGVTLEALAQIRAEELEHFHLLVRAIQSLGGDPTAQTPSADLVGVETMGLMQVLNDPRTTFGDCLQAMLTAELTDVDAWELLAELAENVGEDTLAAEFHEAALTEDEHLEKVRRWYKSSIIRDSSITGNA